MNTSTQILTLAPLLILATLRVEAVDLAALKADAEITFREGVKPFVTNYCIRCHAPRLEAGINLKSALKNPGNTSSFIIRKKAVANAKTHKMPPIDAAKIPTEKERQQFSSSGSAASNT
ncbi:MAG: hypothetical protein ABF370_16275 [Verrucomicrobiales bacterium]|nr:hypothetical protein [Verrucomicrobiaceae bacterium]